MHTYKTKSSVRIPVAVTFLVMVLTNVLADIFHLAGVTTAEVSDAYPNLFAPAGFTFAIWGLIYFLLLCFTLYQLWLTQRGPTLLSMRALERIGLLFTVSCIANSLWIVCWHFRLIPLTMILMCVIFVCLLTISLKLNSERLARKEALFVQLPFSVYFGWITVALIANVTTLLVSVGWEGFGLSESLWMMIIVATAALIGLAIMLTMRDAAYGLVLLWAYAGILAKHLSKSAFSGNYPGVVVVTAVCMALFAAAIILLLFFRRGRRFH